MIKLTSASLALGIVKSIQEVYTASPKFLFGSFTDYWRLIEETGKLVKSPFFMATYTNSQTANKLVNTTLELAREIYLKKENIEMKPDLLEKNSFRNLLIFCKLILDNLRNNDRQSVESNPQKLIKEEIDMFSFLYGLIDHGLNDETILALLSFMTEFFHISPQDPHSEAYVRKSLDIIESIFLNKLNTKVRVEFFPIFLTEIKRIILLRNKVDIVTELLKNNRMGTQLWQQALKTTLKLTEFLVSNGDNWTEVVDLYESIIVQSVTRPKNMSSFNNDAYWISCSEMEVSLIESIYNVLLKNELAQNYDIKGRLIEIINKACTLNYSQYGYSLTTKNTISKLSISFLFDLSQSSQAGDQEIATPIMIKRCKQVLKNFIDDENNLGTMPLPK